MASAVFLECSTFTLLNKVTKVNTLPLMRKLLTENPQEALRILLKRLKVSYTNNTIEHLENHPDFPSLLSINHTLSHLGIENVALRPNYEQMKSELPKPFMVHVQDNGGMYLIVEDLDESNVLIVKNYLIF